MQLHIEEALKKTGHGFYNYAVLVTCCLITNASAIDVFGLAVVLPATVCDLKLGLTEAGLLASVSFIGCIFSVPWGFYSDARGRRKVLLISLLFGFIFALAGSFAPNWQALFVLKLIGCSFSTAGLIVPIIYIGEFTGEEHRDKYMSIMNSFNLACDFVMYVLVYLILPYDYSILIPWLSIKFRPWRACLIAMSVPMGLGFLLLLFLHESPKFLANAGKTEQALEVLRIMHKVNRVSKENYPVENLQETNENAQKLCTLLSKQIVTVFQPPLLWKTLQLLHLFVICYATSSVFYTWFPLLVNTLFNSLSVTKDMSFCERITTNISTYSESKASCNDDVSIYTIYAGLIYGIIFTLLNLVLSFVAKWRKLMLISILAISAASGILLNMISQPMAGIVLYTCILITGVGIGNVASYFVDTYTTSNRSFVTSLGIMMTKVTSFAGTNLLSAAIIDHCNLLFYFWSFYIITGIVTSLFLPADFKR